MKTPTSYNATVVRFGRYWPLLYGEFLLLTAVVAILAALAIHLNAPWPFVPVPPAIIWMAWRVALHSAVAVIVGEYALEARYGVFGVRRVIIPFWDVRLEIEQSRLGCWLDVGTLQLEVGERAIELEHIAGVDYLAQLIIERRARLGRY